MFPFLYKQNDIFFFILSISLVKLHYFQFAFLENWAYKKQEKSIKDQRNFFSNTFFKVFANSVSAHSKILCLHFSYKQHLGLTIQFPSQGMGWPGWRFIHLSSESPWVEWGSIFSCGWDASKIIDQRIFVCCKWPGQGQV